MLQRNWIKTTITTNEQANMMIRLVKKLKPTVGAFDTETTGLHIILDSPFVIQFGFLDPNSCNGYTFAVDAEKQPELAHQTIRAWHVLAKQFKVYLAHNVKFDLHMLTNFGEPYLEDNLSDTMFYIRYAHDALTPANGGPPLGLKDYAKRYIDINAKLHEQLLSKERSDIAKTINLKLLNRLKALGTPDPKYGFKTYTLKFMDDLFKDAFFDSSDLPENIKQVYLAWLNEDVPQLIRNKVTSRVTSDMIPYNWLNRKNLMKYAHLDIVYVLEIYLSLIKVLEARDNMRGIEIENACIIPLYEMERQGFKTNKAYIEECKTKIKAYALEKRKQLYCHLGREVAIGQHELLKQTLNTIYNFNLETTNDAAFNLLLNKLNDAEDNSNGAHCIRLIQELRTLEKWYSVYINRFLNNLHDTDRLYTTINQVGTVSGRVTSDFQQFPSKGIMTTDGEELFSPRKMIEVSGGDYKGIVYLDYSQIELRFQALYTILVGAPDLNLCRAYMPYKCINNAGELFDYKNPEHIKNWDKEWYFEEAPDKHWVPTDVHGATTEKATGKTPDDPEFAQLRKTIGKRVNFAKNYGAKLNKIREMFPFKSEQEVRKIDNAYYEAFPGVKLYHDYCYKRAQYSNTLNLFGVRYYNVSGHKLVNMLVQGSAAFYLKSKIIELYKYCKENNIKSKFQMNIHDELSWEAHKDDCDVFFKFKEIMETWDESFVPIVADMEVTTTTWKDKKEVKTLEELSEVLQNA